MYFFHSSPKAVVSNVSSESSNDQLLVLAICLPVLIQIFPYLGLDRQQKMYYNNTAKRNRQEFVK